MRDDHLAVIDAHVEGGRFDDAVRVLAFELGAKFDPRALAFSRRPGQDLLYISRWEGPEKEARSDRAGLRLALRGAGRWPRAASVRLLCGIMCFYTNRLEQADKELTLAISLNPRLAWAYVWRFCCRTLLARRHRSIAEIADSGADLKRALSLEPANLVARCLWVEYLHDRDLKKEALAELRPIMRRDHDAAWALAERGEILYELGRPAEALRDFDRLVRLNPRSSWSFALRARAKANIGRLKPALVDFDRAVALSPRWAAIRAWRAEARRKSGDARGAFRDFDAAVRLAPGFTLAWGWRGHARLIAGQFRKAISDLDVGIRADCRHTLFYAWRGEALLKSGRFEGAARDFDRAFPFHPKSSWTLAAGLRDREASLRRDLDSAIAAHPGAYWGWALRGRLLVDSQDRAEAVRALARAIVLRPKEGWAYAWRGEALRRDGRRDEAESDLRNAVRLDPGYLFARLWLAELLLNKEDFSGALIQSKKAAALDPQNARAFLLRGRARLALGHAGPALEDIEKAYLLQSKDGEIQEYRRRAQAAARDGRSSGNPSAAIRRM